jgi:hypothetical protein
VPSRRYGRRRRALRAFQAEAARVAREHGYYGPGVNDEIADAIEAL